MPCVLFDFAVGGQVGGHGIEFRVLVIIIIIIIIISYLLSDSLSDSLCLFNTINRSCGVDAAW